MPEIKSWQLTTETTLAKMNKHAIVLPHTMLAVARLILENGPEHIEVI